MCFPALAAIPAAIGTTGASGAFQAVGAGLSALGAAASAARQAAELRADAAEARRRALFERRRGSAEEARLRDKAARERAALRARYLADGLALEGSPVDVLADLAAERSLDEQAVRFDAEMRAGTADFAARRAAERARYAGFSGVIGALSPVIGRLGRATPGRTAIRSPYQTGGR